MTRWSAHVAVERWAIDNPRTWADAAVAAAIIAACDTGTGVPPALRERVFEAFYSTKGDGKGTGLRLAQVAGAARQAGGRVELSDSSAGGACFTLYLPLAESPDGGGR